MAMDDKISKIVDKLIDEIKISDTYKRFEEYRTKVKHDPELRQKINRTSREQLTKMSEYERNNDYAERLEDEYDMLCDITAIHEFSLCELEVCAMYQEVMTRLANSFDLDV